MSRIEPWKPVSTEEVFKAYSRKVNKVTFKLPGGETADFYIRDEPDAVCILGLTPDQEVILVKQFRPGPMEVLLDLPGGVIDKGEEPMAAAKREFLEETGYTGEFQYVVTSLDDAYMSLKRHCFVATNCRKIGEPINTPTEKTEVVLATLAEFRDLLRSGQTTDIEVGYLGLDYLDLL